MRNFKLIGGFGVSEKEIHQKKLNIEEIISNYYNVGIEEFFVGYNPEYWHGKYSFSISPNGRFGENEQISSFETLKKSVEYIHSLKRQDGKPCEVYLTVNGWFYNDITFDLMKEIIRESIEIGVDGLIVGSYEILEYLSEIHYQGKVHISTILNVYNEYMIRFLIEYCKTNKLNLNRVVLPRELTIKEIKDLVSKFQDISFEVFGQGDYCRYSNGNCFAEHKYFSRDLCTFVLKHGLETRKRIRYDFKNIITSDEYSNQDKEYLLNSRLETKHQGKDEKEYLKEQIKHMFSTNSMVSKENKSFSYVFDYLMNSIIFNQEEIDQSILGLLGGIIKFQLLNNFISFIYDSLQPESNFHNQYVLKYLQLLKLYIKVGKVHIEYINEKILEIEKFIKIGKEYYENEIKNRGEFGLETYYKFMLYNRTSTPFFKIFNEYKNIEVVKIPLRGRDPNIFKMGLDLIDDSINHQEKYINDVGTQSGKYFHYSLEVS